MVGAPAIWTSSNNLSWLHPVLGKVNDTLLYNHSDRQQNGKRESHVQSNKAEGGSGFIMKINTIVVDIRFP